jgi:conjugal transfer ATP-binding protein TraC
MVTDIGEDMDMLKNLIAQMMSPSRPLTDYEMSQVEINLRELWDIYGRNTTISMLAEKLINYGSDDNEGDRRVRDLGVQLVSYTEKGAYGKYFTGETNVRFDNNFVVLELEELNNKKALQSVIMLLIMYKITQEMYLSNRAQPKIVIIDEAWDLMSGGSTAGFIEKGYRRVRKYKGGFITGTQSVQDYYMSAGATASLVNADWMFMLRQKPESITALEKEGRLSMDAHLRKMMLSITTLQGMYSEVLVHCGQMGHGIGRLFFDKFSLLLNSSKAEDFEAIKRYRESGLDTVAAIEQVMRDRGQL